MELQATYIGGPTALFEARGLRFLTDPTFDSAPRDYPSGASTLHKLAGPAVAPESVGNIDLVLLSHDHHWDNFDPAGKEVAKRAGRVITTVDGATRVGANAVGLAPWQTHESQSNGGPKLLITATPARHGPAHMDRGPVIGFVLQFADDADSAIYFAGDTVWYEGVEEVAKRFHVTTAILNLGAASVKELGPFHLTMTAEEGVTTARAFPDARIVPLHYEGWEHFREDRPVIEQAFRAAGLQDRLAWLEPGQAVSIS